ncbi:hypothetical protein ACR3K2_03700 [Cryptosporidium serpentis]
MISAIEHLIGHFSPPEYFDLDLSNSSGLSSADNETKYLSNSFAQVLVIFEDLTISTIVDGKCLAIYNTSFSELRIDIQYQEETLVPCIKPLYSIELPCNITCTPNLYFSTEESILSISFVLQDGLFYTTDIKIIRKESASIYLLHELRTFSSITKLTNITCICRISAERFIFGSTLGTFELIFNKMSNTENDTSLVSINTLNQNRATTNVLNISIQDDHIIQGVITFCEELPSLSIYNIYEDPTDKLLKYSLCCQFTNFPFEKTSLDSKLVVSNDGKFCILLYRNRIYIFEITVEKSYLWISKRNIGLKLTNMMTCTEFNCFQSGFPNIIYPRHIELTNSDIYLTTVRWVYPGKTHLQSFDFYPIYEIHKIHLDHHKYKRTYVWSQCMELLLAEWTDSERSSLVTKASSYITNKVKTTNDIIKDFKSILLKVNLNPVIIKTVIKIISTYIMEITNGSLNLFYKDYDSTHNAHIFDILDLCILSSLYQYSKCYKVEIHNLIAEKYLYDFNSSHLSTLVVKNMNDDVTFGNILINNFEKALQIVRYFQRSNNLYLNLNKLKDDTIVVTTVSSFSILVDITDEYSRNKISPYINMPSKSLSTTLYMLYQVITSIISALNSEEISFNLSKHYLQDINVPNSTLLYLLSILALIHKKKLHFYSNDNCEKIKDDVLTTNLKSYQDLSKLDNNRFATLLDGACNFELLFANISDICKLSENIFSKILSSYNIINSPTFLELIVSARKLYCLGNHKSLEINISSINSMELSMKASLRQSQFVYIVRWHKFILNSVHHLTNYLIFNHQNNTTHYQAYSIDEISKLESYSSEDLIDDKSLILDRHIISFQNSILFNGSGPIVLLHGQRNCHVTDRNLSLILEEITNFDYIYSIISSLCRIFSSRNKFQSILLNYVFLSTVGISLCSWDALILKLCELFTPYSDSIYNTQYIEILPLLLNATMDILIIKKKFDINNSQLFGDNKQSIDPITLKFHFTWLIMYDRALSKKTQEIFDSICSDEDLCHAIIDRYLKVFNQISMPHPLNTIVLSKPSLKLLFLIIRYNSSMIKVISQYPSYFFIIKKATYMLRNELMEYSYPFQESNNLYNIYKTSAIQYTFLLQKSSTYSEIVEFVQSSSSILSLPNQRLVLSMTIWLSNTYNNSYLDEECIKKTNEILSKAFSYDELFHLYSLLVNIFWYNQSLSSSICTISKNKNFRALIFHYLISSLENPLDIAVLSYLYSLKLYSEIIKDIDFKHLLFPHNWLKFSRESTISLTIDINSVLDDISKSLIDLTFIGNLSYEVQNKDEDMLHQVTSILTCLNICYNELRRANKDDLVSYDEPICIPSIFYSLMLPETQFSQSQFVTYIPSKEYLLYLQWHIYGIYKLKAAYISEPLRIPYSYHLLYGTHMAEYKELLKFNGIYTEPYFFIESSRTNDFFFLSPIELVQNLAINGFCKTAFRLVCLLEQSKKSVNYKAYIRNINYVNHRIRDFVPPHLYPKIRRTLGYWTLSCCFITHNNPKIFNKLLSHRKVTNEIGEFSLVKRHASECSLFMPSSITEVIWQSGIRQNENEILCNFSDIWHLVVDHLNSSQDYSLGVYIGCLLLDNIAKVKLLGEVEFPEPLKQLLDKPENQILFNKSFVLNDALFLQSLNNIMDNLIYLEYYREVTKLLYRLIEHHDCIFSVLVVYRLKNIMSESVDLKESIAMLDLLLEKGFQNGKFI